MNVPVAHFHEIYCLSAMQMFQIPALIIMSIAATRMYRSLSDFGSDTGISETYETFVSYLNIAVTLITEYIVHRMASKETFV